MRILHAPNNIANVAWELSRAQRRLGHHADVLAYFATWTSHECDFVLHFEQHQDKFYRARKALGAFLALAWRYDVFHFHFANSFVPTFWDVPLLKLLRKKLFFHFHGCDIRDRAMAIRKDKFAACRVCDPIRCATNMSSAKAVANRYGDGIFVSTPDLLDYLPEATWLPACITLPDLPDSPPPERTGAPIRIGHAPSSPVIKGTEYVLKAVDELRRRGHPVELLLVEKMAHCDALEAMRGCDILLDQFRVGAYGVAAVEGMALAKPVVCYIRPDVLGRYPSELPIVNANGDELADRIEPLVMDSALRYSIGQRGRAYVERYHEASVVARKTLAAYRGTVE